MTLFKILKIYLLIIIFIMPLSAFAETYYVKNDGNDNLAGTTDATAWATIGKVNSSVSATGDDVYFKCGDTWTGTRLYVDWYGTSGNRAIIGAYYGDGTIGVSGNKPIIDGDNSAPSTYTDGLIYVVGGPYVTVENIKIINSAGHGLRFHTNTDYGYADNVDAQDIDNAGIMWWYSDNGKATDCTITLAAMAYHRGEIGDWPACLMAAYSQNAEFQNCKVYNVHGEGIGLYKNSHGGLVEKCLVYNAEKVGIYIEGSHDCIIRHNLVYGTTDTTYHRYTNPPQSGAAIWQGDEGWVPYTSYNNKIYGNLVAYTAYGFVGASEGYGLTNVEVYNNTFIGCDATFWISASIFSNSAYRNNISWPRSGANYGHYRGTSDTLSLVWSNNNWSTSVSGDRSGTGDVIGVPSLSKTTGWDTLTAGSLDGTQFALQGGADNIDAGYNVGSSSIYDQTPNVDESDWTATPISVALEDQDGHGDSWEIGGDVYTTTGNPPPEVESVTISSSGTEVVVDFDQTVLAPGGDGSTWALVMDMDGAVSFSSPSIDGDEITYTLSRTVWRQETFVSLSYTQGTIQEVGGTLLEAIPSYSGTFTNSSLDVYGKASGVSGGGISR